MFAAVAEDVTKHHKQERKEDFEHLIRNGTGYCLDPVQNEADSLLLTAVCYSAPMQLKPGQVSFALLKLTISS